MQSIPSGKGPVSWTWADLLSTYRYWGLFFAYVLTMTAEQAFFSFAPAVFHGLFFSSFGEIESTARLFWIPLSLLLSWVAIRTRPKVVLLITGAVTVAAVLAATFLSPSPTLSLFLEAFTIPLLAYVIFLVFLTLIASSHGSAQTMLIAIGLAWATNVVFSMLLFEGIGKATELFGSAAAAVIVILLVVGVLLLLPVNGAFFQGEPPARGRVMEPAERAPIAAALLSLFVPFYLLYWVYRIHGEEAWLRPSARLLTPRAAAWILVIPVLGGLMFPVMLSTLADHHNEVAAEAGIGRLQRPWAMFLCGLLCGPVAVGVIQSSLNRLVNDKRQAEAQVGS